MGTLRCSRDVDICQIYASQHQDRTIENSDDRTEHACIFAS